MATSGNLIEVRHVTKRFGKNKNIVALDDCSLGIKKGEVVVIVGPSGSGKSTMLRTLNLLETPTEGEVVFEGVNIADKNVDINKHRQKMGMVFQHFNLFPHMTVMQNLTLAPTKVKGMDEKAAEEMGLRLLDKVGLKDRASAYPIQLSGGQKQRIAIVRALCMEPDVMLFDETVMENIRLGRGDATDEEVMAAARAAQCEEFIQRLPQGYQTNIGENGSALSGGERQRISIARALLKNAPIVLLDEATASMDAESETLVQDALSVLLKDKTVMVIAHRMRTVANADKIVVLDDGKVSEMGTPAELMKKGGLYAHLVELQQGK